MSENNDHETGGTTEYDDIWSEPACNTKLVIVSTTAPTNKYDGQRWLDTSEDPPVLKTYDETNNDYVERDATYYETGHNDLPGITKYRNGLMVVEWDATDGKASLWVRSNNWWWALRDS